MFPFADWTILFLLFLLWISSLVGSIIDEFNLLIGTKIDLVFFYFPMLLLCLNLLFDNYDEHLFALHDYYLSLLSSIIGYNYYCLNSNSFNWISEIGTYLLISREGVKFLCPFWSYLFDFSFCFIFYWETGVKHVIGGIAQEFW
jgi:hypothetical protein